MRKFINWLFSRRVIGSEAYLIRWHLIPENPYLNVFLHHIKGHDQGRDLHDHPWNFWTVVLRGGYVEEVPRRSGVGVIGRAVIRWNGPQWRGLIPRPWRHRHAEQLHRITHASPHTWTLVVTGRRRRVWGFQTDHGWIAHFLYLAGEHEHSRDENRH